MTLATFYELERQPEKAIPILKQEYERGLDPLCGLSLVVLADALKDTATRDVTARQVATTDTEYDRPFGTAPSKGYIAATGVLAADIAGGGKGRINDKDVEKLLNDYTEQERAPILYCLGKYWDLHGRPDEAINYWKSCMSIVNPQDRFRTLAGAELLAHKVKPEDYADFVNELPSDNASRADSPASQPKKP